MSERAVQVEVTVIIRHEESDEREAREQESGERVEHLFQGSR